VSKPWHRAPALALGEVGSSPTSRTFISKENRWPHTESVSVLPGHRKKKQR